MTETETKTFSLDEVSKHNDSKSPWLIIDDKVYDVKKFLDEVGKRRIDLAALPLLNKTLILRPTHISPPPVFFKIISSELSSNNQYNIV